MTQPAERNHKSQVQQAFKRQSWVLCISLLIIILIDLGFNGGGLVVAKSFACGAVLSFGSQYIITQLTFRNTGYQARQRIVSQFYLGEISRWLMAIFGFALIFIVIKPLIPVMVILGYFWLQLSYLFILWKV